MTRRKTPRAQPGTLDRHWHLARTPIEIDVTELEYALMRSFEAFGRWQGPGVCDFHD
jgi:predicted MarR family transcription regulator